MAFQQINVRLPEEYIRYIKSIAGDADESQGYMIQQALYGSGVSKLPPPRRRDKRPEGKDESND